MKKLDFTGENGTHLIALYSIFSRDQSKLETRAAIRQNARIMDKLEDLLTITPQEGGGVMVRLNTNRDLVMEIDDADFEALHAVVRAYKPTNVEARVVDNVLKLFEKD